MRTLQKHILIVDDEHNAVEPLRYLLEEEGHRVTVAFSGMQALEQLKLMRPDLIVVDLMMPGMNGAELAQQLRARPVLADVPLFFISGVTEDQLARYGADYDAFMRKPLRRAPFLERLNQLL